ncbi:MAG TPA: hypothetical protein VHN37_01810 [Actinomycetota bacterium]|nr:hypothetical protein [Actinomycetota bacterium]
MSRALRVLAFVCVLVVLPVQPAKACSCAHGDPRDMFARSDGAFVGTFLESHPVDPTPTSSDADTVYTFLLDEEYKGELGEPGDTVEVHAPLSGASCGLETATGEQYGIFLYVRESDGAWTSNLCSQVAPETMREGASPLPAPTSDGPVRMVAGGSFGDTQTIALDRNGRTVGYGAGDSEAIHVSGCRGGARSVEVALRSHPEPPVLVVRDLSSLDAVASVELPFGHRQRYRNLSVAGVHCAARDGRKAFVFGTDYGGPEAEGVLLAVDRGDVDVVHEGTGRSATFAGGSAYVQQGRWGRRLTRVSLADGGARGVVRLPGRYSTELAASPDRTMLAGIAYPSYERMDERPARLYVVDVARRRVWTRSLGTGERSAHVLWLSNRRIAMFVAYPDASRVYDLRLHVRARFGRWPAHASAVVGDTAYGVDYDGRLWEVDLPSGTPRVSRRLPSPLVYDLAAAG